MNLQDTWNQLNTAEAPISLAEVKRSMGQKPQDLMQKLHKQLRNKMGFIVLFMPLYIGALVYAHSWTLRILFGIIFIAHVVGLWFFMREWRYSGQLRLDNQNSRAVLQAYTKRIRKAIQLEEWVGLFLYPISAAAGYIFSLWMRGSMDAFEEPRTWWVMAIAMVVLTPMGWWAARKMNAHAFDRHLKLLDERIQEMED